MPTVAAELVQTAFDAFNRRDVEGLLALCEPDVEVHSLMTEAERADYRGFDGVRDWLGAVLDVFPDWCPTPGEVRDHGCGLVSPFTVTATARASGAPVDQRYWMAAQLSEAGRLRRFGFYRSEALALEAAGVAAG